MNRFSLLTSEAAGVPVGLTLISGSALVQRHAASCAPGLWSVRHFELSNHRTEPTANAVVDDFGNLREVAS